MTELRWSDQLLRQLKRRAEAVGPERFLSSTLQQKALMLEAAQLYEQGIPAEDTRVRQLAERSQQLGEVISGGDPKFGALWRRMNNEGYLRQGLRGPYTDPALWRYLGQV